MNSDIILDRPQIVWVGRFSGASGYASATRSTFAALQKQGWPVIGVDIQNQNVFGEVPENLSVQKKAHEVRIRAKERQLVHVVAHDCPDAWSRVEVRGLASFTGYTVTEIESLPFDWQHNLGAVHRLWTASDFNRDIYSRYTKVQIDKVYHVVDQKAVEQAAGRVDLDSFCNRFKVLHVVSNFNRKDTAAAIKAYVRAFRDRDDTTLLIKLPERTKTADAQKFLHDAVFPEISLDDPSLPHITAFCAKLSNEDMWSLYSGADCSLSTERAKGFDLISAEAMAAGCPAIGIGWSANLEFMSQENSYLIPAGDTLVPVDPSLITAGHLYDAGQWATFDLDDVARVLVDIYNNPDKAHEIGLKGKATIADKLSAASVVDQMAESFLTRGIWETAGFQDADIRIGSPGKDRIKAAGKIRFQDYEELTPEEKELFRREPHETPHAFIEKRRDLWRTYGCVMPPRDTREKTRGLKNKFLGQSIVVMGNGPSLRAVNFDDLIGVPTFAANRISLAFDKTKWRPTFYTALDWLVTPDNYEEYNQVVESTRFFPMRCSGLLEDSENTYWYDSTSGGLHLNDKFQTDASQPLRGAGTVVTAMLQLAWHMGFRRFYLLGCDASYSIPKSVEQSGGDRFGNGVQIHLRSTQDDDNNHFDPRYFGAGKQWHDPNVNEMKRGFRSSQLFIEQNGGQVFDCTEGGKLTFIPKCSLAEALEQIRKTQ